MDISIKELSQRLADQSHSVVARLLPAAKPNGNLMVCGDITGRPGDSLKIHLTGQHAGQWKDWSSDQDHGDLLDLWRLTKGLTPAEAIKEVKSYLGIVDSVRQHERKAYAKPPEKAFGDINPFGRAMAYLREKRKLTDSTVSAFRVTACPQTRSIVFPLYSPSGELKNRSYRTLDARKRVWQDSGCAPSLFGWQALAKTAVQNRTVLLAEGQIDAMTWHQWGVPALSIPNGTGESWIDYEWDNLAVFTTIYLAFDQDDAGRKITESATKRLGKHRCLVVSMPKKDANDCLLAGYGSEDAKDWVANAKAPKIDRLVTASEMGKRLLAEISHKEEPFTLPFMGIKWPYTGFWFRPGEVTVWGGYTGAGKSTILNFIKSQILADQRAIFEASLELKVEVTLRRLATIFTGERLDEESALKFIHGAGEYLIFADVVGSMKRDELMEMMWFAFKRYGCGHFMIDSLMRIEDLEEDYPAQGAFCNRLQDFAKETNTHVHLVAHLAKPSQTQERPTMYGIKGSSLLVNNADNVILISRNNEKEKLRRSDKLTPEHDLAMHDAEIIIEKQRETGWTGFFKLKFDPRRYIYREWKR
jgi:twinkle protein